MKKKQVYKIMFLTGLLGLQISADQSTTLVANALDLIAAVAKESKITPNSDISSKNTSLTKPVPKSTKVTLQPTVDPKTLPGITKIIAIPSTVTSITIVSNTNVGDLYNQISFSAANIKLINAALAAGKSLQFAINIQSNNGNYTIVGTIYDLAGNVVAQETRQNAVNSAPAGSLNTASIAVDSPITLAGACFSGYDFVIQLAGQEEEMSYNNFTLASTIILAASAQSVTINSPIQFLTVVSNGSVAGLSVAVKVSVQNILDINTALAAGKTLSCLVTMNPNAAGNYDFVFAVYDQDYNVIAQEARASIVNSGTTNSTIAQGAVIPVTAGTFSGANINYTLLNTQDTVAVDNLSFVNTLTLAPTIPASSIVDLPQGVTSLTGIAITPQFGSTTMSGLGFDQANFNAINAALAAGNAVSIQCIIENNNLIIGAYNFTKNALIGMQNYGLSSTETASAFSGYQFAYAYTGSSAQPFSCVVGQTVTLIPYMPEVAVFPIISPGINGGATFTPNTASLKSLLATVTPAYNESNPVSVLGGLSALQLITVQLTDANSTAYVTFNFTPTSGLQNVTQEVLDNGLYIAIDIEQNVPAQGQYSATVSLIDAQENIYAQGSQQIVTQMIYGWIGFNMINPQAAVTPTSTRVQNVVLASQQAVLYRQQTVTSSVQ